MLAGVAANPNSPQGLVFSRSQLQAAMYALKSRLPEAERIRNVFRDLLFDTNGATPYSERLDSEIDFLVLSGVIVCKSVVDPYYQLDHYMARRLCRAYQSSPEDLTVLEPLVPIFVECLNAVIARRGDPKP